MITLELKSTTLTRQHKIAVRLINKYKNKLSELSNSWLDEMSDEYAEKLNSEAQLVAWQEAYWEGYRQAIENLAREMVISKTGMIDESFVTDAVAQILGDETK